MTTQSLFRSSIIVGGLLIVTTCAAADDALGKFRYQLAKPVERVSPKFELDVSEVADNDRAIAWGQQARLMAEEWFPLVCRLLATDDWTSPRTIRLVLKKELAAPGVTSGTEILLSVPWITQHPDDFGMVIHELTHVVQNYPSGRGPGWLVEGIADYIRYWRFEPERPHGPVDRQKSSYRDGYGTTAAFLAWLVFEHDRRIVTRLDAALRRGEYSDDLFHDITGKQLDRLWAEFLAAQRTP